MYPEPSFSVIEWGERFYTMLRSLNQYDTVHLRGIVQTLLSTTDRDAFFTGNYYRGVANVETLLSIKSAKDFQAIAMLARTLFELAVDTRLISLFPTDGIRKVFAYSDLERLRAARQVVKFKESHPSAQIVSQPHQMYIDQNAVRITAEKQALWPGIPDRTLNHWSAQPLAKRVAALKEPFDLTYALYYRQLSWYVHSGMAGIVNLEKETFRTLSAVIFSLASQAYIEILTAIIIEYKISAANEKIRKQLELARLLPLTNSKAEQDALERALLA